MIKMVWAFLITFSMLIVLTLTQSHAQQVWTYDFGDVEGTYTSTTTSTTFLPNADQGGGTAVVRAGGGAGLFLENPGNPDLGTYSQLRLTASSSTAMNRFEIEEFSDPTNQFYIKFTIRFIEGENGEHEFLIGSGGSFGTNNSSRPNAFAVLTWKFNEAGLETERRTASGAASTSGIGEAFLLDTIYDVEIYGNNTTDPQLYYRNGQQFTVPNGQWTLWINGSIVNTWDGQLDNLEPGDMIDSFRFQSRNSENNQAQIEIDDIVYSNSLPDIRTIEGDAGWRMLALPYNTSVEQLARQNMIQGVTDGPFPGAGSNILTLNTASNSWQKPKNISEELERGEGFIWGFYDNADVLESKPLPLNLTIAAGMNNSDDEQVSLAQGGQGWNLIGNPFSTDLFVNDLENWVTTDGNLSVSTDISATETLQSVIAQVYNSETGNYEVLDSEEDKVATFQGFVIQNNDATSITIPSSAQTDGATFFKQNNDRRSISFQVIAEENGTGKEFIDRAFNLYFTEMSVHGWDVWDATKLTPLSNRYIGIAFLGERNGESVLKAQDSRPFDLDENITIPASFFSAGIDGNAKISIQNIRNIPQNWTVEIEDTHTGIRQTLGEDQSYSFNFSSSKAAKEIESGVVAVPVIQSANVIDDAPRFLVHINPGLDNENKIDLPTQITLHQNYPNPFNPTTVISYELPQVADVQLQVFDMLGRQVATLVDGTVQAGTHQVTFDASNLSSGVYIYRLHTAEYILTRKLTVLK